MSDDPIHVFGGIAGNISCMQDLDLLSSRLRAAAERVREAFAAADMISIPLDDGYYAVQLAAHPQYDAFRRGIKQRALEYRHNIGDCFFPQSIGTDLDQLADRVSAARLNYEEAEKRNQDQLSVWESWRASAITALASTGPIGQAQAVLGIAASVLWSYGPVSVVLSGRQSVTQMLRDHNADLRGLLAGVLGVRSSEPLVSAQTLLTAFNQKLDALGEDLNVQIERGVTRVTNGPRGIEDLVLGIKAVAGGDPDSTAISITKITAEDGSIGWLVANPGTESMSFLDSSNPADMGTNTRAAVGAVNAIGVATVAALVDAGAKFGQPVVLTGHSQGGITSAALAADRAFTSKFKVAAVLTVGSPVNELRPANNAQWLSLEHAQDPIPDLLGGTNEHSRNHTTAVRDLDQATTPDGQAAASGLMKAHGLSGYADTARILDKSADPSIEAWRCAAGPIFDPSATYETAVYTVRRV